MIQQIQYMIHLVSKHNTAYKGVLFGLAIPFLFLGWISIAYSRINPFLVIIIFPLLSGICIEATSMIMIRSEGENFLKLYTIPGGLKYSILGAMFLSTVIMLIENVFFEVATVGFRSVFEGIWSENISPSPYIPDIPSFVIILGVSASIYACYISLIPWMIGHLEISTFRDKEDLIGFKRFILKPWFGIGIIAIVLIFAPISVMYLTIISTEPNSLVLLIGGGLAIIYGLAISQYMWKVGFKKIQERYTTSELEGW